jgi:uncharacterized protein (DUF488 family)
MMKIWTVGHSTRSGEEFVQILLAHGVEVLVDVRTYPGSRRYPHFNGDVLAVSLKAQNIEYKHQANLGGRRKPRADSHNSAWRNEQFRGYADYMETEEFKTGVEELLELASEKRVAIMCAEAVWWRCHRSLISDWLKAEGHELIHIIDERKTDEHPYTSAARVIDGRLSYKGLLG